MHTPNLLTRKAFLGGGAAAATALLATPFNSLPAADAPSNSPAPTGPGEFPPDFWWGTATAAYQVEGAVKEDGRKPSVWDTFSHTPGKIRNNDTGDVTCDFYHRYPQDIKLMADLGTKHYRFSISWSRVIPTGRGPVNDKGFDFYSKLIDALLASGIIPHVTLYHWDLPQALQDKYRGWENRQVVDDFGQYVTEVAKRLGDRVQYWMTVNEIFCFCGLGYGPNAFHAPGLKLANQKAYAQLFHHALLAHGTGCMALRAASPGKCNISLADNSSVFIPVIETPQNIAAAQKAFNRENGQILIPMLTGRYDEGWMKDHADALPDIADGDMKIIGQPLDGLGLNCYTGTYVKASDNEKGYEKIDFPPGYPVARVPWLKIVPEAIYWGFREINAVAGQQNLPLFISENGCPDSKTNPHADDIADVDRLMYFRAYLANLRRAIKEGYPVIGYFAWSLLDNFEWADGYGSRFGIVHVDFATQTRTPKLTYHWYQAVIRQGKLV